MDIGLHDLAALFGQLGLANDEPSIRQVNIPRQSRGL